VLYLEFLPGTRRVVLKGKAVGAKLNKKEFEEQNRTKWNFEAFSEIN
jgi:hypothetical protein